MVKEIARAGEYIKSGRVILYPTDTIWGIGCDATDPNAVQKIYEIKKRSDRKSMLVLMAGFSMLTEYLEKIPLNAGETIRALVKPTTVIYPGAKNLAKNLLGEDGSIGIRITSDKFCQELIRFTGKPIVSTSANVSGSPAPSSFNEIDTEICEKVDHVVDWRRDEVVPGSASTIIRLDDNGNFTVLRP